MEAIILAGGRGSRLGSLTHDTPKPMLPVRGIPFLERLIAHLEQNGFSKIILSLGYKASQITTHFSQGKFPNSEIIFSIESIPLGTGGALKQALGHATNQLTFIFNGDTYVECDYKKIANCHHCTPAGILTIGTISDISESRYSKITVNQQNLITSFGGEAERTDFSTRINGGIYVTRSEQLVGHLERFRSSRFSLEQDFLSKYDGTGIFSFPLYGQFLDIGTPEDYRLSQQILFID